jgi:hypothetical protein
VSGQWPYRPVYPGRGGVPQRRQDLDSLPQLVPNNAIQSLRMLNADVEVATDNTLQSLVCPTTSTGSATRRTDVFFANKRPGYLERNGLTAEELCATKPGLIHARSRRRWFSCRPSI